MEKIDVQKLPRKELLQLCSENNVRTAGVKQDDLVRLLQKKLHPEPATDPSRFSTKTRSQILKNKSPISSPRGKEKSTEETLPTPGLTSQKRGFRPLVLADDPSLKVSIEPSPRKSPSVLPRKLIAATPNSPPAQRSDFLRKKVNALTTVGKLQAQERGRQVRQSDGSPVKGRNRVATAAPIGKRAQDRQPQRSDGAFSKSRSSNTTIGVPKKFIRSTSMEPVKRPGTGQRVTGNEVSRFNSQTSPKLNAAYLEAAAKRRHTRAFEGAANATATSYSTSDFGSQKFDSFSEIASDAGHHAMSEDSDPDDGRSVTSVASEPASRFASQLHSHRAIASSKLGRPSRIGEQGRSISLGYSEAREGNYSDPRSDKTLISPLFIEGDDSAFSFVGDAHEQEINSFLNADIDSPDDISEAERSHQIEDVEDTRTPVMFAADCQKANISESEERYKRKQDAGNSAGACALTASLSEPAPLDNVLLEAHSTAPVEETSPVTQLREPENELSVPQSIQIPHLKEPSTTFGDQQMRRTEDSASEASQASTDKDKLLTKNGCNSFEAEGQVLTNTKECLRDNLVESAHNDGVTYPTANVLLALDQRSVAQLHQESSATANTSSANDLPSISSTSTGESRERANAIFNTAPLPHPDMIRSATTVTSGDMSQTSLTMNEVDSAGEQNRETTLRFPCDELQQNFEIKMGRDYNKDGSRNSNIVDERSVEVSLLQHPNEIGRTHSVKRSFPMSILHWCSQFFFALFGVQDRN